MELKGTTMRERVAVVIDCLRAAIILSSRHDVPLRGMRTTTTVFADFAVML